MKDLDLKQLGLAGVCVDLAATSRPAYHLAVLLKLFISTALPRRLEHATAAFFVRLHSKAKAATKLDQG